MEAMTNTERWERSVKLLEEAKAVIENGEATGEDKAQAKAKIEESKRLRQEIEQAKELDQLMNEDAPILERKTKEAPRREPEQKEFKSFGEFLLSVANAFDPRMRNVRVDPRLVNAKRVYEEDEDVHTKEHDGATGWKDRKATMVENVGARGGFLVPVDYMNQLMAVDPMRTPVRARATVIPMRRRQINIPVLDQTGTTAAQPHWFGGMVATWTDEGASKTQSDPTFRQVQLVAHKLICYTRSSDELLDDSAIGLDAFLRGPMGFTGAIEWYTEYAFLRGTGGGQPLGIINAGATISVAATANPPAPASIYGDLVNMLESFLPGASGLWFINQRHMSDLLTANGPTGNASYLWGDMVNGVPGTLLGYPIVFTEKLPAPGTAGSILLADPRYYLVGDRQAITVDSTNAERFQYDETSWRAVARVDGQPWLSAPLTLADGTAQVSPFVILGAKST